MVSEAENLAFCSSPSADKIKKLVFFMDALSASRINGFPNSFYQPCWDIICFDIITFMQDFFKQD